MDQLSAETLGMSEQAGRRMIMKTLPGLLLGFF